MFYVSCYMEVQTSRNYIYNLNRNMFKSSRNLSLSFLSDWVSLNKMEAKQVSLGFCLGLNKA